jgi:hypothetical protein
MLQYRGNAVPNATVSVICCDQHLSANLAQQGIYAGTTGTNKKLL